MSTSLTIGQLERRSGVSASALRFYERKGLLGAERTASGHRRYPPDALRRIAFIRTAHRVGIPLADVKEALDSLPGGRTPTAKDWARVSAAWRAELDDRIHALTALRDDLSSCIGCGCLSLTTCRLSNPGDVAATRGAGPRYLLGDRPADLVGEDPPAG